MLLMRFFRTGGVKMIRMMNRPLAARKNQPAGLDFLGLGIDQIPPQSIEEILTSYPRLNFKSAFRDLLVEHCRRNPAAQILAWTDEVARTAGCTLHGQPIPTTSQLMLAAPFAE
jgi:hypothetical protein